MLPRAKASNNEEKDNNIVERRKSGDRRVSNSKTRFPFIDDNSKLVMKERRVADRREKGTKLKENPLKIVKGIFKK